MLERDNTHLTGCPQCGCKFHSEDGVYRELENCSKLFCDEECADKFEEEQP